MENKDITEAYIRGVKDEKRAWLDGERCEMCGKKKVQNMTSMCDNCLEEY